MVRIISGRGWSVIMLVIELAAGAAVKGGEKLSIDPPQPLALAQVHWPQTLVTATRTQTPTEQVGSSFTVVNSDEIDRRQLRFLGDSLKDIPGVDVRQTGGAGSQTSIFLRGANSNHTKITLDGIDFSDPSAANAIPQPEFLPLAGFDRIEVVRGPQSALYGSDAIGGVVALETAKGRGDPSFSYLQEFGSFRTFYEQIHSAAGDDRFNYNLNVSHLASHAVSSKTSDTEDDPFRNLHVGARFGVNPTPDSELNFFFHYFNSETEFDGFGDFRSSQTDSERYFVKAQPLFHLLDGVWTSKLNVSTSSQSRHTFDGSTERFRARAHEIDWQNDLRALESHLITAGAAFRHEEGDDSGGFSDFDDQRDIAGVYLQDQIQFGERLTITPGGRLDHFSDFGSQWTYRLAAAYRHLETQTTFRGSAGSGFNAPSFNQLSGFGANSGLKAEKSLGFDFGFEQSLLDKHLIFGAAYFRNDFDNLIVAIDTGGFTFVNFNIEQAATQGVETFLFVEPVEKLTFRGSYTYTDTEAGKVVPFSALAPTADSRLLRRPLHKMGADVSYRFWEDRATVSLGVLFVSDRLDTGSKTAPAYTLVNLAASVKLCEHVSIHGRIENLFNEQYQDVLGFNSPGIACFGGFKVEF